MNFVPTLILVFLGLMSPGNSPVEGRALDKEYIDPLQTLSNFKGYSYDYAVRPQGVYTFYYMLPQSSRFEERTASGEVKGNYAFVAPEGNEFKFKYEAGKKGFQVESNALPIAPEDTDEVKKAKEEFFEAYQRALALAVLEGYGEKDQGGQLRQVQPKNINDIDDEEEEEKEEDEEEDDDDEQEEEEDDEQEEEEDDEEEEEEEEDDEEEEEEDDDDDESDEDDDESDEDEESSEEDDEESSEEDDEESSEEDDEESSEEDDEESSEEDDDDDDDDEESSEEDDDSDEDEEDDDDIRDSLNIRKRLKPTRRKSSTYEIPNYINKNKLNVPTRRRVARNYRTRTRNVRPRAVKIRRIAKT